MPPANLKQWTDRAVALGAKRAKIIRAATVKTGEWVRMKCRFGCGGYGGCLMCPPRSPTPEETQRVLDDYRWAVLFEAGRRVPRDIAPKLEREIFLAGHYKALAYSSGPCRLCASCNMEGGCRHPDQARPAMEACGIDVYATVRANGFKIEVLTDTRREGHYFGMVLIQ